jgi:hypothetical protein
MPPKLNPLEAIKQSKGAKAVMSLADEVRAEMAAEKAGRLAELTSHSGDKALPLKLPRANLSNEFINQQADRVARQMLGEHVTSGKAGDTKNLAGRSMKESQRLKGLNYKLSPTGTVAKETPYTPRKGDVKVAFPGDQTVSDKILEEVEGFPIDSHQQGGAYYGLGQQHLPDPEFWKSTETPAKNVQAKVDRVAELYEPDRVIGSHLAMGPTSNNFAMHLADANLRAIDWSKAQPSKINQFDKLIANGYFDPVAKKKVTFPEWPGLADPEAALAAMKENTALRKWVNNRFKTPSVTEPLGLPNGLDIQYAITEPRIRDMEINMTGLMTGELKPKALVEAAGAPHNTYSHRILGKAGGPQEVLTPFVIDFPDAAQHIASTKRPSDFTGTIQKVFPHQVVDDQYINQYNQYRERIKKLTGQKRGGLAHMAKGGAMRGMKKLKGIYGEVEASMGRGKGAEFEQTASPLNIMREGTGGQFVTKHMDKQLQDIEDQAFSPAYQKMVEESLKADRARAAAGDKAAQLRIPTFEKLLAEGLAKRQWVNSNLKNYVKKQMGSPDDPVRALAEKGVSHVKKLGNRAEELKPYIQNKRKQAGLPQQGLAQSDEAKIWETLSDNTLFSKLPAELPSSVVREDEWMKNLPAGEKVMLYGHEPDLGFQDLIGDIERRMDAGQLRPDQLNKVTVADAVKSLHDERVRKEENSLRAMQSNAATKLHKEYPTGYKWVEISANKDSPLPEGWEQLPNGTYVDPQGQGSIHNPNYIAVQEALEHEGDIMGHCVGDYCNDVYNKGTRILSLRDPRGESHATLQVLPEDLNPTDWYNLLPAAEKQAVDASGYTGYNIRHSPQFKEAQAKVPPRIKQIKGKQDEPLVKKYRPMVADIANTGDYSYIDELHNAGLKEKGKVLTEYEEQWLKSKGYQVPKYILEDDINVMRKALYDNGVPSNPPEAGMAKGGVAKGAKAVMSLADQVRAEMAAEKQYGQISGMVSKMGEEGRSPIIPVPNRWFLQPDKFPHQQKLIERVLQKTGMNREDFPSGAFIDPRTGEVLDSRIMDDLGVVIDPKTNRPMMSAKGQSGLEVLDPKTGAYTKSNLVRKGLFKPEGGDPMLNDLNFIATIEKGDAGHRYGLATEYASPTELYNTGTGANPTLRPRSRGDLFGVGDVVGQVRIGKSNPHDVYEKLFVAPKGSDVQGKKLSKAHGGLAMAKGGRGVRGVRKAMSLADEVRAEMAAEKKAQLVSSPTYVMDTPAMPDMNTLNKTKPVYGARGILPREQAEANKAAFLEPSVVKDRMYHGTRRNFTRFSPSTADSVFVTPDPTFASGFAHGTMSFKDPMEDVAYGRFTNPNAKFKDPEYQVDNANILPVRVQVRNPFDYEDEWHVEALRDWLKQNSDLDKRHIDTELDIMANPETSANWSNIEHPVIQKAIKALGHDAYYTKELDTKNLGVYNPNMVKSDIGNIGTWSTKTPEITEKKGGLV